MFLSSSTQYALLLLPAGVLSAIARQPMMVGRAQSIANNTAHATSTQTTTQMTTTMPDLSTITSTSSWDGIGTIPSVFCPSAPSSGWCRVSVGTVQLNFWPTGAVTKNHTYPSTVYLSKYDYTMTSPWVYFLINTMIATDWCGNLIGTTITDFITSYAVTDVSTLQPFVYTTGTQRVGLPEQLKLSDLKVDCPEVDVSNQTYEEIGHNFVKGKFDPGCNPDLEWPTGLKSAAKGLWSGCGRHDGGGLGIFDPPAPVSACPDNDPGCLYEGAATTTSSPSQVNTALPDKGATTTTSAVPLPTVTSSAPSNTGIPDPPAASSTPQTDAASNSASTEASNPVNTGLPAPPPQPSSPGDTGLPAPPPQPSSPGDTGLPAPPLDPSNPVDTGIPVPSSDPSSPANTRLPAASPDPSTPQTNAAPNQGPSSANPQPIAIATLAGSNTISATTGASYVVVGSQTAIVGGSAITVSGQIVQLQSSAGLVVQNTADGSFSTYALPSAAASPANAEQSAAVFGGQTISGLAVASSVAVFGGHTMSIGGSVVTLSENQVASLGSSGLVIEAPGGGVTTIAVPEATSVSTTVNGGVAGTGSVATSNTSASTSTSIGALIMANFSAGDRSSQLSGNVAVLLGSFLVAAFSLL